MNKFLKDLEKELKKLKINDKEIKEILDDHKEMLEVAKNEGLTEEQIEVKFGNPKKIAKEILGDTSEKVQNVDFKIDNANSCVSVKLEDYNLVKTFPVVSDEIKMDIGLVSEDVAITSYDGESIQVLEKNIKKLEEYTISLDKDVFTLRRKKSFGINISFSKRNSAFVVLVPSNAKVKGFQYGSVSGDSEINGIITNQFRIKSTSGDVEMTNIDAGEFKISTVSGDVEIANLKAATFHVSVVSGDLEIKNAVIETNMYFNTVSGDVELQDVECLEADFKSVSGDLEGKEFYPKEVSLKSVSGDIDITNSNVLREVNVISKKSVSGDISIK